LQSFPKFHQRALPKWGLFLVGSTISGFSLDTSDIDMCLVYKGDQQLHDPKNEVGYEARYEALKTLNELKEYLMKTRSKDSNLQFFQFCFSISILAYNYRPIPTI
jgi:predicted nucleotidyltransferase